jgi:hypothetical protein
MADDLKNRGPADRKRISLEEAHELRYWCGRFACTEDELRAAVAEVGHMAADVEQQVGGDCGE